MWDKHDQIKVILPPKNKKVFFHSSNLLEILSIIAIQNPIVFEFPPNGNPK